MRILLHVPISLFLYLSLLSKYRADSDEPPCFVVSSARCAELKHGSKCELSKDGAQIFCCNVTKEQQLVNFIKYNVTSYDHILGFHMRDSSLEKLEIPIFDQLRRLASFSLTNSNITHINGAFEGFIPLTCLNISYNIIEEIHPFVLVKLKGLKNIVLSNNTNMTILPVFSNELSKGFKLDVSGNLQLECKYLINLTIALAEQTITFSLNNRNSTMCSPPSNNKDYARSLYMKMDHIDPVKEIVANCPFYNSTKKCDCSVHTLDIDEHNKPRYQALVNCSHRSLTSLPNKLPIATRVLDVSDNNITSFDGIGNKTFDNILELYADNNKITSLKPLEGTPFLYQFLNLSLKNNKIEQIKVYMLSNVFDRLQGPRIIMLANNELNCDCTTSSTVKSWLTTNKEHVPDYAEIYARCNNGRTRVIDLDHKDWCSKPTELKDFIRFVIYGELIIFVLLIGKVSYDYYIFKTFGYLPWPASRMPKLPCDWCFEN